MVKEDGGVRVCQIFDESPKRSRCVDGDVGLLEKDEGNELECVLGSLVQDRVECDEMKHIESQGVVWISFFSPSHFTCH